MTTLWWHATRSAQGPNQQLISSFTVNSCSSHPTKKTKQNLIQPLRAERTRRDKKHPKHQVDVNITGKQTEEIAGTRWGKKKAEAVLKHLTFK